MAHRKRTKMLRARDGWRDGGFDDKASGKMYGTTTVRGQLKVEKKRAVPAVATAAGTRPRRGPRRRC